MDLVKIRCLRIVAVFQAQAATRVGLAGQQKLLETLLASKGAAATPEVDAMAAAWERAAHATPHGQPIVLENDPQRRPGR